MREVSYVLPIRRIVASEDDEFDAYLGWLDARTDLVVVDGSPEPTFHEHARRWRRCGRHVPADPDLTYINGKVRGVLTGMRLAGHERVIIADDDVRYDESAIQAVARLLDEADAVVPQNYFDPCPWHAQWDTARTLVNRAIDHDWPGTVGVRRSVACRADGYDGDVLFENLELIRTIRARGGSVVAPLDCYVRRVPPTVEHFVSQRVRQAYDELARPARFVVSLAIVPSIVLAIRSRQPAALLALGAPAALAAAGRARADGRRHFSPWAVLLAPFWMLERGVCTWIALGWRVRGGCRYHGRTIKRAAHSLRTLRRAEAFGDSQRSGEQ
jgi:hypothetical protein